MSKLHLTLYKCYSVGFFTSYSLQVTENPIIDPENTTELNLRYTSASIEVQKEEYAYSFLTLVSDIGGVLGMFIGFNFLMIWDWTCIALTRSLTHFKIPILPEKAAPNL